MKMKLDEAKKILKNAGYIIEDTETQDDEHSDLVRNSGVGDFKSIKKIVDLEKKHLDLEDKIANAKHFNDKNEMDDIREMISDLNNGQCGDWKFRLDSHSSDYYSVIGENEGWIDDEERISEIEWVWYRDDGEVQIYYGKQQYGDCLDMDKTSAYTVQQFMDVIRDDKYV